MGPPHMRMAAQWIKRLLLENAPPEIDPARGRGAGASVPRTGAVMRGEVPTSASPASSLPVPSAAGLAVPSVALVLCSPAAARPGRAGVVHRRVPDGRARPRLRDGDARGKARRRRIDVQIPTWSPGAYEIKPFYKRILNARRARREGHGARGDAPRSTLTWKIAASPEWPIVVSYERLDQPQGLSDSGRPGPAQGELRRRSFRRDTFVYVVGRKTVPHDVTLPVPEGWLVQMSLAEGPGAAALHRARLRHDRRRSRRARPPDGSPVPGRRTRSTRSCSTSATRSSRSSPSKRCFAGSSVTRSACGAGRRPTPNTSSTSTTDPVSASST